MQAVAAVTGSGVSGLGQQHSSALGSALQQQIAAQVLQPSQSESDYEGGESGGENMGRDPRSSSPPSYEATSSSPPQMRRGLGGGESSPAQFSSSPPPPEHSMRFDGSMVPDSAYSGHRTHEEDSASPSNSDIEDEEREFGEGGKRRAGGDINGYISKKRRKQSKPIRLGSESQESGGEEGAVNGGDGGITAEEEMEEGEVRHGGGANVQGGRYDEDEGSSADDGPLNLSSGSAKDKPPTADTPEEMGGLRLRGNQELLQNPPTSMSADILKEQQQQAALYNQQLAQMAAASGSPFGLPPHFLFPFTSMPGVLPSSGAAGINSGSGSPEPGLAASSGQTPKSGQIFNIEAYCKLCNKEFCNKYFLKTHMANKHGIYSENSPTTTSSSGAMPRFDSPSATMSLGPPPPTSSLFDRGLLSGVSLPTTPVSISGSFMAMASSLQQQQQRNLSETLSAKSSPSAGGINFATTDEQDRDSSLAATSPKPRSSTPTSTSASPMASTPKSLPPPLISNHLAADNDDREAGEKIDRPGSGNETDKLAGLGDFRGSLPPGLRLPMQLPPHMNPFGPLPFFNMSPSAMQDMMRKEEEKNKESGTPTSLGMPLPGTGSGQPGGGNGQSGGQDRLRQMGVINADAFCEYCCKEFCNKYFLRVHKLKKHGVCSPELPPEKVQKILAQMAKEASKTGQPMPPLSLGGPPLIRPPTSLADTSKALSGMMRQPNMQNFLNLPPLELAPGINLSNISADDSENSSDQPDEREEGRQVAMQGFSPRSITALEPECELRIDENSSAMKSPSIHDSSRERGQLSPRDHQEDEESHTDQSESMNSGKETNEGLANLQNMIMKLNSTKSAAAAANKSAAQQLSALSDSAFGGAAAAAAAAANSTVCKKCNKDMENKYFLHAHMMNEHGILNADEEEMGTPGSLMTSHGLPISLPQYPADLSKLTADLGLGLPCPITSVNGLPKLSEKPLNYGKSIFEQMQGLQGGPTSFLEQMKNSAKMDLAALAAAGGGSPLKRPSLGGGGDRDPNKKPASLSRSYCEICKKELCNKYFMKTHMMKMHGIMMDPGPPGNNATGGAGSGISIGGNGPATCQICKKEMSSTYFLKAHMASVHGLNEDGSPIPPGAAGMMASMFPGLADFSSPTRGPPGMGEFSRLLMQQGEKSMEQRLKELDKLKESAGHVCSLCSNVFPDIVTLQVHIIKSHGALPPGGASSPLPLDSPLGGSNNKDKEMGELDNSAADHERMEMEEGDEDIAEHENDNDNISADANDKQSADESEKSGFDICKINGGGINDLLQRQMMTAGAAALMNPLLMPGLAAAAANGQSPNAATGQLQGLFNMFLSEMLKKVQPQPQAAQKDTPPQTPPISPSAAAMETPPVSTNGGMEGEFASQTAVSTTEEI